MKSLLGRKTKEKIMLLYSRPPEKDSAIFRYNGDVRDGHSDKWLTLFGGGCWKNLIAALAGNLRAELIVNSREKKFL